MHRACVRTALINEISTVTAPEVVLGCRRGIASGDLGTRSVLLVPLVPQATSFSVLKATHQ
jgi:hypothetical protein